MEQKMQISSEIDRTELFGNLDVNLNLIKEATGVEMIQREDQLILKGENRRRAANRGSTARRAEPRPRKR